MNSELVLARAYSYILHEIPASPEEIRRVVEDAVGSLLELDLISEAAELEDDLFRSGVGLPVAKVVPWPRSDGGSVE